MPFSLLPPQLLAERPHLFSSVTLPVAAEDLSRMAAVVAAIGRVVALPDYQARVLAEAPQIARFDARGDGVFFGYDFHLSPSGPKLIEINTNAGGGLLAVRQAGRREVEEAFVAMFRAEMGGAPLGTVALIDEAPQTQYLYPEFLLFQELLGRHGIQVIICDGGDLMLCHGGLWHGETKIDLVYNRLTDFAFEQPAHAVLREAYLSGAAVFSPHPRAHALYANKRNLTILSDQALLASWGVDAATLAILAGGIPATEVVRAEQGDDLWSRRKGLFFKPAAGFGSKAAYRGDKLTKRVFEEILAGDYVAQALVPPTTWQGEVAGELEELTELKVDLRCYVYRGAVQLVAARLWQGQTTNFRTPGGGFAVVVEGDGSA
jgi:hypothetical protein